MMIQFHKIPCPARDASPRAPRPAAVEMGAFSTAAEASRRAASRPADFTSRDALKRSDFVQSLVDVLAVTIGIIFGSLLGVAVGAAVGIPVWLAFAGR